MTPADYLALADRLADMRRRWIGFARPYGDQLDGDFDNLDEAIDALRLAAEQQKQMTEHVPPGWVLVPVEPTFEMLAAATEEWGCAREEFKDIWHAMLAAAPRPQVREEEGS